MSRKIMVIDGNSILNRAYFAIPPLSDRDGRPVNAVYGFLSILFRFLNEDKPDAVAVAFDMHAPTFRHQMYDGYKGTRKSMESDLAAQLPIIKEVLGAMDIKTLEVKGFEADDILGTVANRVSSSGDEAVLISGDRDLLQIASESIKIRIPKTKGGSTTVEDYKYQDVVDKLGVTPAQLIDVKALMGDTSDNIPGVPGIGEKTALKLIIEYGDLENALNHADEVTPKRFGALLNEHQGLARMSKTLATINTQAPVETDIDSWSVNGIFSAKALEQIKKLDFRSFYSLFKQPEKEEVKRISIKNTDELNQVLTASPVAYRLKRELGQVVSAELCVGKDVYTAPLSLLHDFFLNTPKLAYDAKADMTALAQLGLKTDNIIYDHLLAAYLLGDEPEEPDAGQLFDIYEPTLKRLEQMGQVDLMFNMEMPLMPLLFKMEQTGIGIDLTVLENFGKSLVTQMDETQSKVFELAGEAFNINSPKQLGVILFEKMKLKGGRKTKTGYSTAADVLEKLAKEHEIVSLVLSYRSFAKLKSSFVDGLIDSAVNGRVHTTFNQAVTATGRLSSTDPNLQNIPIRTALGRELRRAFVPTEGWVFIDGDYSQIELRILAHMSADPGFTEAFISGQDIHRFTAAKVLGIEPNDVTPEQRSSAKAVNFGIVYGIGAYSLSEDLNISMKEAQAFIDQYFERYPSVKTYLDNSIETARQTGFGQTMFGRKRTIPDIHSQNFNLRSFAERVAMNMPIQGSAADIIKLAMVNVDAAFKQEGLAARILLQVHDELLIEAPKEEAEKAAAIMKREMEQAAKLSVPLVVDTATGGSWYETK